MSKKRVRIIQGGMDTRKLRVVYFQQNLAVGACEEYLRLLMEGVDKSLFEVLFACPRDPALDIFAKQVEELDVEVLRYSLAGNSCSRMWRLYSLFRALTPDIAHFNDPCLNGIIAARLSGVPVLIMTHHTPELNRGYNFKGRLWERIAFRNCGLNSIFTSEYDRRTALKKDNLFFERSFIVYYGLPPARFARRHNKKDVYDEFSLDEKCRLIANIARLSPQKGQRYLIEAASLVIREDKSARFFFVGEGELESELKTLVRQNGLEDYFIFTGYRGDVPRLLSAFEILVMPSLFEGLCFAVIEAQAMGVPVIASSVGGMRRSVSDGKTGILVPPSDAAALAQAILWMLSHPQEAGEMGLAGKRHFAELFTQERMVQATAGIYKSLFTKLKR